MLIYRSFIYMKDRLSRDWNQLHIWPVTGQVCPPLCIWACKQIQLSEGGGVWGKQDDEQIQIVGNPKYKNRCSLFWNPRPEPRITKHLIKEHPVLPNKWSLLNRDILHQTLRRWNFKLQPLAGTEGYYIYK